MLEIEDDGDIQVINSLLPCKAMHKHALLVQDTEE